MFVDLPKVGAIFAVGGTIGEVESTKSVSELFAPVSGTVVAVNDGCVDAPEQINSDPYGAGWLCEIEVTDTSQVEELLDAPAYTNLTAH